MCTWIYCVLYCFVYVCFIPICSVCSSVRTTATGWKLHSICSCSKAVYKPVWHIPLLSVQWINFWRWTDELSETCRISCQNKFVKLVHPVGFIIKKEKSLNPLGNGNIPPQCFQKANCWKSWGGGFFFFVFSSPDIIPSSDLSVSYLFLFRHNCDV